ncbi:hypothetical protein LPJ81_003694 [Coemansia sp. IMI 209127]|nr:hypothetical protein LPJ81_003694 [Coemansia sp. IMI 209127]
MYVSSTHLYFSGTGISLSSTTGACKASNDLVQQQQQQQPAVPLWTAVQCQSSLSLASTPSLSQEYASYELRSQRPLYGPYSQSSWPQTTRLTFSMDEIPQQIQQSASQSSKRSNLGDRSSMAKPLRRTTIKLALPDITRVTKELTLGIWPNAMTVSTTHRQYIFTNFLRRDKAYQCLYDVWNSTLPVSSQMQPLRRAKQRSRIPEQYTTQQQLAVPLARMSTEGAPLQPSLPLSTTANDSPHQQTPLQVDVLECATTNTVAACHGSNESLVVSPSSAETEDIDTADRTLIKRQSRPTTSPQQHALHSSNAHKIHHNNNNNNNFFAWQRLDPVMLVGQLIGVVSRSTLFILLSLVVFCLLSSITFL